MRLKRNCNGCKALNGKSCSLGYSVQHVNTSVFGIPIVEYKPLEICEKPTTLKRLFELLNAKRKL